MKILVVEDDAGTREVVIRALEHAGHGVVATAMGRRALDLVGSDAPDLIVLDVGLPDLDGFEVCRRLRLNGRVPIVMLTARDDEDDIMRAFKLGADDYVTKPFSARLLVARVATVLRRTAEAGRRDREELVRFGRFELDARSFEVRMDGQPIRLTPLEFRILHILAANKGRVVPYGRLIEFAWGHDRANPSQLKIRVHALRRKLDLPSTGEIGIKAITGTGYALRGL